MVKVQVLGTGCSKCGYLLKNAQAAANERQAGDVVEKIDDIMQVLEFNPSALPTPRHGSAASPVAASWLWASTSLCSKYT
jgi:hypothetical protein